MNQPVPGRSDAHLYPDSDTLLQARSRFFERAALGPDGGYASRWVRIEAKPFPFYFPNTRSRVTAAKLHDLHHVATGYRSDWPGEAEIAAWELAAGCGPYFWAWFLNLGAFGVGLALFPREVWRAFVRGGRSRTLYPSGFEEERLGMVSVGALRGELGLDRVGPSPRAADRLAFAGWVLLALLYFAPMLGIAAFLVWKAASALGPA